MKESKEKRSEIMRAVKDKNTAPELLIRKLIYRLGFRYRLHDPTLPGKPDIIIRKLKKAIFIHGCFWHGHRCKRGDRVPSSNRDYWVNKIQKNKDRDRQHIQDLEKSGWSILVIWECEIKDPYQIERGILAFLNCK